MSKVVFDMSMSLDRFVKASNATLEQPLGEGTERLHQWGFSEDERDREALARGVEETGAIIAGRRTYDDSLPWWDAKGPHPPARVLVLTHESALEEAKAAAGEKDVFVMGGPDIGRQFMEARLVDEIELDCRTHSRVLSRRSRIEPPG